jgi:hypothetical protein
MFIDNSLVMANAQVVTTTAASTSFIDTLAAGDSFYPGARFFALVDTAIVGQGATTVSVILQTDSDSGFATAEVDLLTSPAIVETTLVAGAVLIDAVIPFGCKRYLRAYWTVASGPVVTGKLDARIVLSTDRTLDKVI